MLAAKKQIFREAIPFIVNKLQLSFVLDLLF